MSTAILRGSRAAGYRSTIPLCCPHCTRDIDLSGTASEDKTGPHIALWAVQRAASTYSEADLKRIYDPTPLPASVTGVSLPRPPGNVKMKDDPVPRFDGSDV